MRGRSLLQRIGIKNRRIARSVALALVAYLLAILSGIEIAGHAIPSLSARDGEAIVWITFAIVILGSVSGFMLFASMTYFYFEDQVLRRTRSRLFGPVYFLKLFLPAELMVSAAQGVDILSNNFQRTHHILYAPGTMLFQAILIAGVVGSMVWLHAEMLRGRGWSRARIVRLIAGFVIVAIIIIGGLGLLVLT